MPRRSLVTRPAVALGFLAACLCAGPGLAQAPEPIRLERWAGRASLYRNPGPGSDMFRLIAVATWGDTTPRQPGRYALRLSFLDGQTTTTPLSPLESAGATQVDVLVPVHAVRDLRPDAVAVTAAIVDQRSGAVVSNTLDAGIANFPTPASGNPPPDPGPFGWGTPLLADSAATLPRPGPDGLTFVRLPIGTGDTSAESALFVSASEVSNRQAEDRLGDGYTLPSERSDEFPLEADEQPAFGIHPIQAERYCEALRDADETGIAYRLPTREEWLLAARAGGDGPFWWGDEPSHPEGANFLGPEPALMIDATAPTMPGTASPAFVANSWGLFHTFGNVAEWATVEPAEEPGADTFARLGGHFRTEPAVPLEEPTVSINQDLDRLLGGEVGDDLFVGVRPVFALTAATGAELIGKVLSADDVLASVGIEVAFDPARATATLSGNVAEASDRRRADERLRSIWWLAAVENQLSTPTLAPGELARLGEPTGPSRRSRVLDVILETVPVEVRWADTLPVVGSSWWMNVYTTTGGHLSYKLDPGTVGGGRTIDVHLDRRALRGLGAGPGDPISLGLSVQAPAPSPNDSNVVSNVATLLMPGGS